MKFQLNVITPLGTLVSEEYDSDLCSMDEIEAQEIDRFTGSGGFYSLRTNANTAAILGRDVLKTSILLIKSLDEEPANGND